MLDVLAIKRNITSGLGRTRFTSREKADTLRSPSRANAVAVTRPGFSYRTFFLSLEPANLHQCRFLALARVPGTEGKETVSFKFGFLFQGVRNSCT